jgi:hypothetical protein
VSAFLHPLVFAGRPVVEQALDRADQSGWRRWVALAASGLVDRIVGHSEQRGPAQEAPVDLATLDIVFVVGFWRSGTTLLHELMTLDPQAAAPTLVDSLRPALMHRFRKLRRRLIGRVLPANRGVDRQPLGPDRPFEEDFAIAQMGGPSSFLAFYFPSHFEEFLNEALFFEGKRRSAGEEWCTLHRRLVTDLARRYPGRRLILKSPVNSTHLLLLSQMYPRARFVRIDRPAQDVCRSLCRLLDQGALSLEGRPKPTRPEIVARLHARFMRVLDEEWRALAPGRCVTVRYEELITCPVHCLRRAWTLLGERWTPEWQARVQRFWSREASHNVPLHR